MGLSVGGLISGMDTQGMVSQLVDAEKAPLRQLERKEAAYNVKLSLYSSMEGYLDSLKIASKKLDSINDLTSFKSTSSDSDLLTASADKTAISSTYNITVHNLAEAHRNLK